MDKFWTRCRPEANIPVLDSISALSVSAGRGETFFLPLPSEFYILFFEVDKKVNVCTNGSSPLPQKTLLLKRLISSPAFNSLTL